MSVTESDGPQQAYTRREALAAMMKYSAVVGGSAATIVTAEGLVSAASAYPDYLKNFCQANPTHWICTWDGWDGQQSQSGGTNGRIQY